MNATSLGTLNHDNDVVLQEVTGPNAKVSPEAVQRLLETPLIPSRRLRRFSTRSTVTLVRVSDEYLQEARGLRRTAVPFSSARAAEVLYQLPLKVRADTDSGLIN